MPTASSSALLLLLRSTVMERHCNRVLSISHALPLFFADFPTPFYVETRSGAISWILVAIFFSPSSSQLCRPIGPATAFDNRLQFGDKKKIMFFFSSFFLYFILWCGGGGCDGTWKSFCRSFPDSALYWRLRSETRALLPSQYQSQRRFHFTRASRQRWSPSGGCDLLPYPYPALPCPACPGNAINK